MAACLCFDLSDDYDDLGTIVMKYTIESMEWVQMSGVMFRLKTKVIQNIQTKMKSSTTLTFERRVAMTKFTLISQVN